MDKEIRFISTALHCDKYQVEAKINEGSYGEIFKVRHRETNEVYAIKVMEISKLEGMNKLHEAGIEILILQKLNYPGIIKIFEVIQTDKYIGIVMELCPFGDIFHLMKTINRQFDLAFKKKKIMVYYLAQILQTIDYLHKNGIIHRDIKPQNIVLGSDLKVRLIDFGTAKVIEQGGLIKEEQLEQIDRLRELKEQALNQRISFVGTTNYMSPESIDLKYSQKSDIWAFGILAYKFYCNKLPYEGKDSLDIFKQIKINQIPIEEDIEPEFKELFKLTLCKDPDQRPTASELKKIQLFQNIDFKEILNLAPPISKQELTNQSSELEINKPKKFLFEKQIQKRMFFGNYKPRCLTMSKTGRRLMMAYRYIPSKIIKNEFELNPNDYAAVIKDDEFEVVTSDKKYRFRVCNCECLDSTVDEINNIIRQVYCLQ